MGKLRLVHNTNRHFEHIHRQLEQESKYTTQQSTHERLNQNY